MLCPQLWWFRRLLQIDHSSGKYTDSRDVGINFFFFFPKKMSILLSFAS